MDTLFWTALNPNIRFADTNRAMFGRFLYRLEMAVEGASILRDPTADITEEVTLRNIRARNVNYGGSWRTVKKVPIDNIPLLEKLRECKEKMGTSMRMRIEEPNLQIYAEDEQQLVEVARMLRYQDNEHFVSIMRPSNVDTAQVMLSGKVLRKSQPKFGFRAIVRDGRYSEETKSNLLTWLDQMGDQVKIPDSFRENLEKGKHGYIWGAYIYLKDPRLSIMLNMIDAKLITRVEEFYTA